MDVTAEIQRIIDHVKSLPNSLERNKTVSHLHDAKFAARYISDHDDTKVEGATGTCICPFGAYRKDCPVHGS